MWKANNYLERVFSWWQTWFRKVINYSATDICGMDKLSVWPEMDRLTNKHLECLQHTLIIRGTHTGVIRILSLALNTHSRKTVHITLGSETPVPCKIRPFIFFLCFRHIFCQNSMREGAKKKLRKKNSKVTWNISFLYGPRWHASLRALERNIPCVEVEVHGLKQQIL